MNTPKENPNVALNNARNLPTTMEELRRANDNLFKIKQAAVVENVALKKRRDELERKLAEAKEVNLSDYTEAGWSRAKEIQTDRDSLRAQLEQAQQESEAFCREMTEKFGKPILRLGDAACLLGMQAAQLETAEKKRQDAINILEWAHRKQLEQRDRELEKSKLIQKFILPILSVHLDAHESAIEILQALEQRDREAAAMREAMIEDRTDDLYNAHAAAANSCSLDQARKEATELHDAEYGTAGKGFVRRDVLEKCETAMEQLVPSLVSHWLLTQQFRTALDIAHDELERTK